MTGSASSIRFVLRNCDIAGRSYATGTDLGSGAVFGRIAGRNAAVRSAGG